MRASDRLGAFVADALRAGHTRPEITAALTQAGWSEGEARKALADWAEVSYPLPVPRPRPAVSAREALVYGLMFVALAISVFQAVNLGFALIDAWLGDPADAFVWSDWRERSALASLVVFAPLFLLLNLRTASAARADRSLRRSAVRDWLAHGAMFVAALTLVGDLVSAISAALGGGLHPDFLAKSALVAAVSGAIYLYFRGFTRAPEA
ncbi:hypothetical protein OCH239_04700 [Roseivivax halodurans JCM 10272]|uniref:DUF5671 domain-containing protein n=1 Tax=Roseivivax halodurans JCM 10272 TaxID=1449350 RepID=X7EDY3_9RHOB|nr:DUF5671 domain-containing protein [Roseivivax halodurans]ETX14152.1 hypothetical protein OCH239_04700 [Roseivivax halodurans JCM 10272]